MKAILLGTIEDGIEVEIDLDALTDYERLLTDQEVVVALVAEGATGTVTIQGDKVGGEADTRAYTTLTDEDTGDDVASVAGSITRFHNVKLPRFLQLLTTVSAGAVRVYAFI